VLSQNGNSKLGDPLSTQERRRRERLVVEHLADVRAIASRYRNLGLPYDDLVQEGALGLLDAAEHYDGGRGPDFDAYARFQIRRAIRNALTDKSRLIRLPKQIVERRRALDRVDAELTDASGAHPSQGVLAAATGLSADAVRQAREHAPAVLSLDEVVQPDGSTLESLVEDDASPDPTAGALDHERTELVDRAVSELPPRQREVVERHFGIGREPEDLAEIAARLHLSQQRTRTIERDALYRLRDRLERPLQRVCR
jgi:RNA polymerase primary sigma factor